MTAAAQPNEDGALKPALAALEDAIWHALDNELGTPHSGVDMTLVAAGFLERLAAAGYAIVKTGESS